MPAVKLLIAITLTLTCVISLHCVDARTLRKPARAAADDDVTGNDVASRDTATLVKRSAARDAYGGAPAALGVPVMAARRAGPSSWGPPSDVERSRLASLLADAALLEHLRRGRPGELRRHEPWYGQMDDEDLVRSVAGVYGPEDGVLGEARSPDGVLVEAGVPVTKRTIGHLRSPRELHPVYLGLGQNAASAALNTYASLLADEKRRESLEQQQQQGAGNPVRFIGRR